MPLLGNVLFFILGGFIIFCGYVIGGIILCVTIIGIPFGLQSFKLAGGVIAPFGQDVIQTNPPGGPLKLVMNVLWILLVGLKLALMHFVLAIVFAITLVGIPLAQQHLKLIKVALLPFGHLVRPIDPLTRYTR